VLVKPIRSGLKTNLVITTSRRTYLLELTSTEKAWMASVSWDYPKDRMLALQRQAQAAAPPRRSIPACRWRRSASATPSSAAIRRGSRCAPSTMARRSISSSRRQGELPPLFVIGAQGDGQLVNYRFRSPYYIVDRLFGAAELRLGGDKGDVVRIERTDGGAEELTMSQDDTPDLAAPQAGKVAPEAVALRAQPRPVTRLNRRTLAILVGGLSVAVLGALMWSLQPHRRGAGEQTELYNVDRVSKSEGLDALPTDYSKLPPAVPELGPPLPGDLGPAIVKSQQPVTAAYAAPGHDPNDALAQGSRSGGGLVGVLPLGWAEGGAGGADTGGRCAGLRRQCGLRPAGGRAGLDGGPACRPDRRAEPARPERGVPESGPRKPVIPAI
jgi:type IV secretion system protein VirB10